MIFTPAFAGQRFAVLGLARSGMAAVESLLAGGAEVTAWDSREEPRRMLQGRVTLADPLGLDLLGFAGIVVSVGAHSAYYHLLQRHDANLLVPLTLVTPLLTIGFGAWLTGDPIGPRLLIGAGLAIAGVAIIVIRPSRSIFKPLLVRVRF